MGRFQCANNRYGLQFINSGDYIVTVTDANGCTAKDTATISEPDLITGIDSVTACESYTWVDGNTYTASNNTATHTLTAANGCHSVITLNLTIHNSTTLAILRLLLVTALIGMEIRIRQLERIQRHYKQFTVVTA